MQKLYQEEPENLTRPISVNELEIMGEKLPLPNTQNLEDFTIKFYRHYK